MLSVLRKAYFTHMQRDHDIPEAPSRSQSKRDAEALQQLGEELAALPPGQLAALSLPERLREALELARQLSSRGALRRQRQFIGRLMRDLDPEPIRARLEELRGADRVSQARFQETERWRQRLLADGAPAVAEFIARFPHADRQRLQDLLRAAAHAADQGQPPRHARELFRYIQSLS